MRILVSGASIAGPVLAYWLTRYGHEVTVVERSPVLRKTGGHAVDLFKPAMDISERMGVLPRNWRATLLSDERSHSSSVRYLLLIPAIMVREADSCRLLTNLKNNLCLSSMIVAQAYVKSICTKWILCRLNWLQFGLAYRITSRPTLAKRPPEKGPQTARIPMPACRIQIVQ